MRAEAAAQVLNCWQAVGDPMRSLTSFGREALAVRRNRSTIADLTQVIILVDSWQGVWTCAVFSTVS